MEKPTVRSELEIEESERGLDGSKSRCDKRRKENGKEERNGRRKRKEGKYKTEYEKGRRTESLEQAEQYTVDAILAA